MICVGGGWARGRAIGHGTKDRSASWKTFVFVVVESTVGSLRASAFVREVQMFPAIKQTSISTEQ